MSPSSYRVAARFIAEQTKSAPKKVDDLFKEVKDGNPSYSDEQAWATAWSIYCKHVDPGGSHCKKSPGEYLKEASAPVGSWGSYIEKWCEDVLTALQRKLTPIMRGWKPTDIRRSGSRQILDFIRGDRGDGTREDAGVSLQWDGSGIEIRVDLVSPKYHNVVVLLQQRVAFDETAFDVLKNVEQTFKSEIFAR